MELASLSPSLESRTFLELIARPQDSRSVGQSNYFYFIAQLFSHVPDDCQLLKVFFSKKRFCWLNDIKKPCDNLNHTIKMPWSVWAFHVRIKSIQFIVFSFWRRIYFVSAWKKHCVNSLLIPIVSSPIQNVRG
jgi:hypothetical protein